MSKLISFFLRIGIAIPFLYAAIASFINPTSWVGFFPQWLRSIFPENMLLMGFSVYEISLSLWLLSAKKLKYSAALAALTFFAITITNLGDLDIVFRDIGLLFAAVSLVVLASGRKQ